MITRIITEDTEFFSLRDAWGALHAEARGTVYQTYEWLSHWWRLYGAAFDLRVLTGWEGSRLIGIFPCFIQRYTVNFVTFARLRFLGQYDVYGEYSPLVLSSFVDPFVSHAAVFCREQLRSGQCDFVDFQDFISSVAFMRELSRAMRHQGLVVLSLERYRSGIQIDLPRDWAAYERSLKSHARNKMRRDEQALREAGVEFEVVTKPTDVRAFDDCVSLHTRSWTKKGLPGQFRRRERFEEFHRTLLPTLMQSGVERLYFLRINEHRFAAVQVFVLHGVCTAYLAGRDPDHPLSTYGPGRALVRHVIREAIAEGCTLVDLLWGHEAYKLRFGGKFGTWYGRTTAAAWATSHLKGIMYLAALRARFALNQTRLARELR